MSKFRKIVEDIRAELLNVDDAIKANEFATEILNDLLSHRKNILRVILNKLSDQEVIIEYELNNILYRFIYAPHLEPLGGYDPNTHTISLRVPSFELLLDDELFCDLLRHELLHYYDNVILAHPLIRTYKSPDENKREYYNSEAELTTYYRAMLDYVYKAISVVLKIYAKYNNFDKNDLIKQSFEELWYNMCNKVTYSFYEFLDNISDADKMLLKDHLYRAVKAYFNGGRDDR